MDHKIKKHFQTVDPVLASIVEKVDLQPLVLPKNYFLSLCDSIISQQLSEKAGATIYSRFEALFPSQPITPARVLALSDDTLRAVGMSYSKARFVKHLAQSVQDNTIILEHLRDLSDQEVIVELTKLKGIGPWTAEMFLMFALGREDVFSYGDLGLKRAIQKLYKLKKEPTMNQMKRIVTKWAPYRTYASRILWKSLTL